MRVLHLVGRSHLRGAEQVALELAEELDLLGHRDRLLAVGLGHEGDSTARLRALTGDARHRPSTLVRAARALRRELRDEPVDVILCHGAAAVLVAVLATPRRGPAIMFQTILGLADQSFGLVYGTCWRMAVRRIDGVVALTPEYGEEMRRFGFSGPIWPLPNARRSERFDVVDRDSARKSLVAELGVDDEVSLVGLVGYLVEQKRPEHAVEVLAGLRGRGVDAHLVVAGSGPLAGEVEATARRLEVDARVSLLGHREDVAEILSALDVLVLTSIDEGVTGVVVEAAMAGCPVVTYPLGGVAEVVVDGVTGVVLDEQDLESMTVAAAQLLGDHARRSAMATGARERSVAFSMRAVAARYEEALADAASMAALRRAPRSNRRNIDGE